MYIVHVHVHVGVQYLCVCVHMYCQIRFCVWYVKLVLSVHSANGLWIIGAVMFCGVILHPRVLQRLKFDTTRFVFQVVMEGLGSGS